MLRNERIISTTRGWLPRTLLSAVSAQGDGASEDEGQPEDDAPEEQSEEFEDTGDNFLYSPGSLPGDNPTKDDDWDDD